MSDIYIAGIAMTVFGRHMQRSLDDLAREALEDEVKDAGVVWSSDPSIWRAFSSKWVSGFIRPLHSVVQPSWDCCRYLMGLIPATARKAWVKLVASP